MVHIARPLIVIPARADSSRFPFKMIAEIKGKPMLQYIWEVACRVTTPENVVVATDHQRISDVVRSFGGLVSMTPKTLESGTDRVALVGKEFSNEIIINAQGDEPLMQVEHLYSLVEALYQNPEMAIATLAIRRDSFEEAENPNVVKVVTDRRARAVYFSRYPITSFERPNFLKHIGIYAFRRKALFEFCSLPKGNLETSERLEQLRALENEIPVHIVMTERNTIAVDTPEDILRVEGVLI